MTVLFSTHIVDDIEDVCDRVTVMHKGKVMLTGTAAEMIEMAQGNTWTVSSNEEKSGEELEYASCIGFAAFDMIKQGNVTDGVHLSPLYLKKSQAERELEEQI